MSCVYFMVFIVLWLLPVARGKGCFREMLRAPMNASRGLLAVVTMTQCGELYDVAMGVCSEKFG